MNKYGVYISLRQKSRQSLMSVVIKGVEKFVGKYWMRLILMIIIEAFIVFAVLNLPITQFFFWIFIFRLNFPSNWRISIKRIFFLVSAKKEKSLVKRFYLFSFWYIMDCLCKIDFELHFMFHKTNKKYIAAMAKAMGWWGYVRKFFVSFMYVKLKKVKSTSRTHNPYA